MIITDHYGGAVVSTTVHGWGHVDCVSSPLQGTPASSRGL